MVELNFSAVTVISSRPVSSAVASDAAAHWAHWTLISKLAHPIDTDIDRRLVDRPMLDPFISRPLFVAL
jgi:hypothetical protein